MWFGRARALSAQEMEDASGQLHMLTILNELTEMRETCGGREGGREGGGRVG